MIFPQAEGKPNNRVNDFINKVNQEKVWTNPKLNLDDHYTFNFTYFNELKEHHYQHINPKVIFQTGIVLPLFLPFEEKSLTLPFFKFKDKGRCSIELFFSSVNDSKKYTCGFKEEKGIKYIEKRTRCEIVVLFIEDSYKCKGEKYSVLKSVENISKLNKNLIEESYKQSSILFNLYRDILNDAISLLNSFIIAYFKETNDIGVSTINSEQIENISHFRIINPKGWITYNWININNLFYPKETMKISNEKFSHIMSSVLNEHNSFYEPFFDIFQQGCYNYFKGNFINCMVLIIISTEILIKKIITLSLTNDQKNESDINSFLENFTFKNLLTNKMPKIIGGNWNLASDSVAGRWYQEAYRLRNRIVHSGYIPNDDEVQDSINQTTELHNYIFDKIFQKNKKLHYIVDGFKSPFL